MDAATAATDVWVALYPDGEFVPISTDGLSRVHDLKTRVQSQLHELAVVDASKLVVFGPQVDNGRSADETLRLDPRTKLSSVIGAQHDASFVVVIREAAFAPAAASAIAATAPSGAPLSKPPEAPPPSPHPPPSAPVAEPPTAAGTAKARPAAPQVASSAAPSLPAASAMPALPLAGGIDTGMLSAAATAAGSCAVPSVGKLCRCDAACPPR